MKEKQLLSLAHNIAHLSQLYIHDIMLCFVADFNSYHYALRHFAVWLAMLW